MRIKDAIKSFLIGAGVITATNFYGIANPNTAPKDNNENKDTTTLVESPREPEPDSLNYVTMKEAVKKGYVESILDFVNKVTYEEELIIVNKDNYNKRICAGLYIPQKDKVFMKYYIPDLTDADSVTAQKIIDRVNMWNDEYVKKSNLAHEYKHRDSREAFSRYMNAEDYARICQHNEIASTVANLLYEREVYLKACKMFPNSKEALSKLIRPRFAAYREAVEKGIVNPFSTDKKEKKLDEYMIVKVASEYWIKDQQEKYKYIALQRIESRAKTKEFLTRESTPKSRKGYRQALDICYTFIKDGKATNMNFYKNTKYSLINPNKIFEDEIQSRLLTYNLIHAPTASINLDKKNPITDVDPQPDVTKLIEKLRDEANIRIAPDYLFEMARNYHDFNS